MVAEVLHDDPHDAADEDPGEGDKGHGTDLAGCAGGLLEVDAAAQQEPQLGQQEGLDVADPGLCLSILTRSGAF